MKQTISFIGCGHVGQTLGRLWVERNQLDVRQIINRTHESAQKAALFMGSGESADWDQLEHTDFILIGTPDDWVERCCQQLSRSVETLQRCVVFHCSGSLSSEVLSSAREKGAEVASIHPMKSFADPERSAESFHGTYCAIEGDLSARQALIPLFEQIGARLISIQPEKKLLYHAASVFASNDLIALMEVALRCYEQAGIQRKTAMQMMQPLVEGTVQNLFASSPVEALTGPIARGDAGLVEKQAKMIENWNPSAARLYAELGLICAEISQQKGSASKEQIQQIQSILQEVLKK